MTVNTNTNVNVNVNAEVDLLGSGAAVHPAASTWAIVPIKPFGLAKSRLDEVLPGHQRHLFAMRLAKHVLGVLESCTCIDGTLVLTSSVDVARLAWALGARVKFEEVCGASLASIVDTGLVELLRIGARRAIVVMSDLPRLEVSDISELVTQLTVSPLVIAPDRTMSGTNALGLHLPAPLATCFGHEDSFDRHDHRCRESGVSLATVRSAGLAFDVDTADDYRELLRAPACVPLPDGMSDEGLTAYRWRHARVRILAANLASCSLSSSSPSKA